MVSLPTLKRTRSTRDSDVVTTHPSPLGSPDSSAPARTGASPAPARPGSAPTSTQPTAGPVSTRPTAGPASTQQTAGPASARPLTTSQPLTTQPRTTPAPLATDPDEPAPAARAIGVLRRLRAWMLVLPVDLLILLSPILWAPQQWKAIVAMAAVALVLLTGGGRYRARLHLSVLDELPALLRNLLTAAALVGIVVALRHDADGLMIFLHGAAIAMAMLVAGRFVTTAVINSSRRRKITRHSTVLVGGGQVAADLARYLAERPRYGLGVVGFVDNSAGVVDRAIAPRLGALDDLDDVVARTHADVILLADGDLDEVQMVAALDNPRLASVDKLVVPRMHMLRTKGGMDDHIGSIPVMRIASPNLSGFGAFAKRSIDIAVSGLALLVLSPLLGVAALAVRMDGGGSVIFRQTRVGRDGRTFECLKLRSMRPVREGEEAAWGTANNTNRITKVGAFLRRSSIDELPQLWNVLRGDMTLVGPRPERPTFVEQFSAEHTGYARRHRMRTGLTGMAQVSGLRGDTSIADRARADNYYIENWSPYLDIKIVLRTFSEVLFGKGR